MNGIQKVISTTSIYFFFDCYGKGLGGSSGADGGSFIMKKLCPLHSFFSLGQLRGRQGAVSSGKTYIHCIYFSLIPICKQGVSRVLEGSLGF